LLVPFTVLQKTPWELAVKNPANLTNFIQRCIGLAAFILLFVQLVLGVFMAKLTKIFGSWIFKFHVAEGIAAYTLVFLHPLIFMLFNYYTGLGWDPYAVFVNICLLCKTPLDYYYTLGRISFWLVTLAVGAAYFRNKNSWFEANWRKFHVLNYIAFLVIGAHGFLIGTDFVRQPFFTFAAVAYATFLCIVIFIEASRFYKNFNFWLKG